jgi:phosphoribosylformylglycinamidine cyclo-ligase
MPSPAPNSPDLSASQPATASSRADKSERGSAYAAAGVDIEAGERAIELMKTWVRKTRRAEVIGGLGGFAGLFDASALARMEHPVLATSTDGVGTKVAIAAAMDRHDTIGFDLVGMVVDDLVVCGAEPLFLTDYIACGRVVPERIASIVQGISEACVEAGCALLGGETAEHPGLLRPDEYDVAGAATGVVERERMIGADRVRAGDAVIALASSGLHSNGYSLIRHVLLNEAGWSLDRHVPELGRTLGEELLEPTRIYTRGCLTLIDAVDVHALAHVTGGGLAANLARVLPDGVEVVLERQSWRPGPIFDLVQQVGNLAPSDLESTLNMGVGMVAVVRPDDADEAVRILGRDGVASWTCGVVRDTSPGGSSRVQLTGQHTGG